MRARRALQRFLVGTACSALALVVVVAALWYLTARSLAQESAIAQTSLGPVEYASFGQPDHPAVLFVHGTPGGYDQLLPLARTVASWNYRGVTVSRPGYLRTPQAAGSTPEEHADTLAALIESLGLGPTVVVGISGGGPSTLQLALRYPDLVRGVVLICAVTRRFQEGQPNPDEVSPFGLDWDLGALAARWSPSIGLRMLGVVDRKERRELLQSDATAATVRYLFQSLGFSSRRPGYVNDRLAVEWSDLDYPLASLGMPVLLLHGAEDTNVPLEHSLKVASLVPQADLRVLDGAGHAFFVVQREWVEARLEEFLDSLAARP